MLRKCRIGLSLFCFLFATLLLCLHEGFAAEVADSAMEFDSMEPDVQVPPHGKFGLEPPTASSGASSARWHWDNPLPQGNTLACVWGSSGQDVFAVGLGGTILHYDGTAWKTMKSGTTDSLYGVWGSSGQDVFVVGAGGAILHYGTH